MMGDASPGAPEVHLDVRQLQEAWLTMEAEEARFGRQPCSALLRHAGRLQQFDEERPSSKKGGDHGSHAAARPFVTTLLSHYGLALVLLLYIIVDRVALQRSFATFVQCHPCSGSNRQSASPVSAAINGPVTAPNGWASVLMLPRGLVDTDNDIDAVGGAAAVAQLADQQRRAGRVGSHDGGDRRKAQPPDAARQAWRRLSSTSSTSTSSSSSSSSSSHDDHPHEAMFFLVFAIMLGTMVTHTLSHPFFHGIQQSVVMFVLGVVVAVILESFELKSKTGVFGRSFEMWMVIDPHLLLFTLLPPLVTGDAMTIDTHVAKRVAKQCLYLAGPGVAIAGMLTALFLWLYIPYDWPFLLCLTAGSILCATDPVAVVALLKELGASPTLTVQIQGESLLNDGTAIVLYTIAYDMLAGEDYDMGDIITFLVKMAIYAWGLGCLIGYLFYQWIRAANNKLNHHSSIIQISLTVACAYTSFIVAEGGFHISGVLSTVAAALVLAHKMWPEVVNRESMETVWHMLEYLGNTVIFFLAGALSGESMTKIDPIDYLHLLVIYVAVTCIRGALFFLSRPLLKHLNTSKQEVTLAEAAIMTWGGLRGAIGLALAIKVSVDRAGGEVSEEDGHRVLFYVSGIAALTLVVNASSCPALVKFLGITSLPETKKHMLSVLNRQLLSVAATKTKPGRVREGMRSILGEVQHHIHVEKGRLEQMSEAAHNFHDAALGHHHHHHHKKKHGHGHHGKVLGVGDDDSADMTPRSASPKSALPGSPASINTKEEAPNVGFLSVVKAAKPDIATPPAAMKRLDSPASVASTWLLRVQERVSDMQDRQELVKEHQDAKKSYDKVSKEASIMHVYKVHDECPEMPLLDQEPLMLSLVSDCDQDIKILRAVNEAFLSLVRAHYWQMIQHGDFFGSEAEQVLASVTHALSSSTLDLGDFNYLEPFIEWSYEESMGRASTCHNERMSRATGRATVGVHTKKKINRQVSKESSKTLHPDTALHRFIESSCFTLSIGLVIFANAVLTTVEQEVRDEKQEEETGAGGGTGWLVCEVIFTIIFLMECLLKLTDLRLRYFLDTWNVFDFVLVVLGIVGCVFTIWVAIMEETSGGSGVPASETRLIRVAQVFRMMRIVRLFRLYRFWVRIRSQLCSKKISLDVAEHMQKLAILANFSVAHMKSQVQLVKYFGRESKVDTPEVARCIMQSQVAVYKAMVMADTETRQLDAELIEEVGFAEESRQVAEECEKFIVGAHERGVLSVHETESILHPLHDFIAESLLTIKDTHKGRIERASDFHLAALHAMASAEDTALRHEAAAGHEHATIGRQQPDTHWREPEPAPAMMGRQLSEPDVRKPVQPGGKSDEHMSAPAAVLVEPSGPVAAKKKAPMKKQFKPKGPGNDAEVASVDASGADVEAADAKRESKWGRTTARTDAHLAVPSEGTAESEGPDRKPKPRGARWNKAAANSVTVASGSDSKDLVKRTNTEPPKKKTDETSAS